jgi:GNAT superfamily N-acetyltransferase
VEFVIEARPYDHPDVVRMVAEVQAEYVVRYGAPDEAVVDPAEFVPPVGLFLVGFLDGVPVATGGWRRFDDRTAEVKRMYVVASARRRGLSRRMLAEIERSAGLAGIDRLVLNTGFEQPEAVALYEQTGYLPTSGFGYYADHPLALFYEKKLIAVS